MPVQAMLGNLAPAAVDKIGTIGERDRKAAAVIGSREGKRFSLCDTPGQFDLVVIFEMPSTEMLVTFHTIAGKSGTVPIGTTETNPAPMLCAVSREGRPAASRFPSLISRGGQWSTVQFARRYWYFIAAAVACATVASASTLYLASVQENFRECNSVSAACFTSIGMVPCMLLGILALIPVMVAIPYLLRQNETPGPLSYIILGCIVAYTAFDAVNNISAIYGYYQSYQLAHAVLSTTNNMTGTLAGTGDSLC